MALVLIDFENLAGTGLEGCKHLQKQDTLCIFYSDAVSTIKTGYAEQLQDVKCNIQTFKLEHTGKNALDFYIATTCGVLKYKANNQIIIVSNDKGYEAVRDYFSKYTKIKVILASTIGQGLKKIRNVKFNKDDAINPNGCKKMKLEIALDFIKNSSRNNIKSQEILRRNVKNILKSSKYAENALIVDIISRSNFIKEPSYRKLVQTYGEPDGADIYRLVKKVLI